MNLGTTRILVMRVQRDSTLETTALWLLKDEFYVDVHLPACLCVQCACPEPTETKRGHVSPGTGVRWLSDSFVSTGN